MPLFLRYPLCRLFSCGILKILRSGAGFDLSRQRVADNLSLFVDPVAGVFLTSPTLFMLDLRHDSVRGLDVESPMRLNHFFRSSSLWAST